MTPGAYTTTRTCSEGSRILLASYHVSRIIDSFLRLLRSQPSLFPHVPPSLAASLFVEGSEPLPFHHTGKSKVCG